MASYVDLDSFPNRVGGEPFQISRVRLASQAKLLTSRLLGSIQLGHSRAFHNIGGSARFAGLAGFGRCAGSLPSLANLFTLWLLRLVPPRSIVNSDESTRRSFPSIGVSAHFARVARFARSAQLAPFVCLARFAQFASPRCVCLIPCVAW